MEINSERIFIKVYVVVSRTNRSITREFGKFDDLLSYFGGLFGIIVSFLGFFLLSFNEYRYELAVSENAFTTNLHGEKTKVNEETLGFFKYLKYSIYDWVKTLFCGH